MKRKTHHFAQRRLGIETLEARNLLSGVDPLPASLAEQPIWEAEGEALAGDIVQVTWRSPRGATCPPSGWGKSRDINGDGYSDWYFGNFVTDDAGNKVDVWCLDVGIGFYATVFNDKYQVGKCPYDEGINTRTVTYRKDTNGNGRPDALLSVFHRSRDGGSDDVGNRLWDGFYAVGGSDYIQWEFDVPSNSMRVTQFYSSGAVVKSVTQCPPNITGNRAPVAEAGPEQWDRDFDGNGLETITLDGSALL